MTGVFGFSGGPTYRPGNAAERLQDALDQPMSLGSTLWDQAKGGALESFGLGTAIRDAAIPSGNTSELTPVQRAGRAAGQMLSPLTSLYSNARRLMGEDNPSLTEEAYKASPYYRDNIPWDAGMTEDRAAALATFSDAKKVRQFYAEKRPFSAFIGGFAGQAMDPINYIPIVGPGVRAANAARFGVVKGAALTGAADAVANTAIAGALTRQSRESFGDDVSWQATVSELAMAGLIGGVFGSVGGVLERRGLAREVETLKAETSARLSTLKNVQEARVALNEAIGGLANDEEIRLSPNAIEPVTRVAREIAGPDDVRPTAERAQAETISVATEEAKATLERYKYDIAAMQEAGVDIPRVMTEAPEIDAARAMQDQEIKSTTSRMQALQDEPERPNSFGPGLVSTDAAPADAPVFDAGMGSVRTLDAQRAEIQKETTRLAMLQEYAARGEVAPEIVDQIRMGRRINSRGPQSIDTSPARPDPIPEGRVEAESRATRPDDYKALADQYRVDPETGSFAEEAELRQLEQEGRLTADDLAELEAVDAAYQDSASYGEALRSVVGCLL